LFNFGLIFLTHLHVTLGEETCHRTNCNKAIGDLSIHYYSFTKVLDKKFSSWTANKTLSVTGTQKERESVCTKECMKDGKDVCRSVHLSPYNAGSTSTCEIFNENLYETMGSRCRNNEWNEHILDILSFVRKYSFL